MLSGSKLHVVNDLVKTVVFKAYFNEVLTLGTGKYSSVHAMTNALSTSNVRMDKVG